MTSMEQRLGRLARLRVSNVDKLSHDGEQPVRLCNYVDVYKNDTITSDLNFMQATATPAQIANFRLRAGDTVFTKDSETAADIGVPAYVAEASADLICGYHLAIATPDPAIIDPRFLFWAMSSQRVQEQWTVLAAGVTRVGLRRDDMGKAMIPMPDIDEQRRIADFLDTETTRLDALVRARRRYLTVLAERHASELTRLVDTDSEQASTLGRYLVRSPSYGVLKPSYVETGPRIIRITDVRADGSVSVSDEKYIDAAQHHEYRRTILADGDVCLGVVGTIGRPFVVTSHLAGANVSRAVARLQPRPGVLPIVVQTWLRTARFQSWAEQITNATAQRVLNMSDLVKYPVKYPDHAEAVSDSEQRAEARHQRMAARLQEQVERLAERRQALITAAVTGQLDVTTAHGGIA